MYSPMRIFAHVSGMHMLLLQPTPYHPFAPQSDKTDMHACCCREAPRPHIQCLAGIPKNKAVQARPYGKQGAGLLVAMLPSAHPSMRCYQGSGEDCTTTKLTKTSSHSE